MFENLKGELLRASDLDLHYACLCVFHEMTTRRLGGRMTIDTSGNAVIVTSPQATKATRQRTPKRGTKQDAVDTMFVAGGASASPEREPRLPETRITIGDEIDLELGIESYVAVATGPPVQRKYTSMHLASCDGLYSHPVEMVPSAPPVEPVQPVEEPSPPRAIPPKKPAKAKSRE